MKCWICGKEATTTGKARAEAGGCVVDIAPSEHIRSYCRECLEKVTEQKKAEEAEYIRLKKRQMLNAALDNLENQKANLYKLKPAIEKVESYIASNPDKFDSSYEIMAAIILISGGVKFQMQKRILRYQVDIYIPTHKIIVEVDGERHKGKKEHDRERDERILEEIGYDWNIIRISTEDLDKHADRLIKAIDNVMKYRATGKIPWRSI